MIYDLGSMEKSPYGLVHVCTNVVTVFSDFNLPILPSYLFFITFHNNLKT